MIVLWQHSSFETYIGRNEGIGCAFSTSSPCSPNAVHVVFHVIWTVVIDYKNQILHVEPTTCDRCRHHYSSHLSFKVINCVIPIYLIFASYTKIQRQPKPQLSKFFDRPGLSKAYRAARALDIQPSSNPEISDRTLAACLQK